MGLKKEYSINLQKVSACILITIIIINIIPSPIGRVSCQVDRNVRRFVARMYTQGHSLRRALFPNSRPLLRPIPGSLEALNTAIRILSYRPIRRGRPLRPAAVASILRPVRRPAAAAAIAGQLISSAAQSAVI